jgi:hypothetical protein
MDLIRLDSNPNPKPDEYPNDHRQTEFRVEIVDDDPEYPTLRVPFPRFGLGEQRRPSFAVEVNWIDVKGFLSEFMKLGHPEADHLRRMIVLAEAIEKAGWRPVDPPPQEFWDQFPPPQSN